MLKNPHISDFKQALKRLIVFGVFPFASNTKTLKNRAKIVKMLRLAYNYIKNSSMVKHQVIMFLNPVDGLNKALMIYM